MSAATATYNASRSNQTLPDSYSQDHPAPVSYQYEKEQHEGSADDFAKYVKWGLIATAGVIGTGVAGYFLWRTFVSKNEERHAFDTESPTYYAKQIKQGLVNNNWPGADTDTIRKAVIAIPDKKFMRKVDDSYNRLYGERMGTALQNGLKTTEYNEMMAILRAKPEKKGQGKEQVIYDPSGWAERLNSAVNYEWWGFGYGTDEEAIKAVIKEIPSQKAWEDVKDYYRSEYQTEVEDDLDDDLDSDDYDFRDAIAKKPLQ